MNPGSVQSAAGFVFAGSYFPLRPDDLEVATLEVNMDRPPNYIYTSFLLRRHVINPVRDGSALNILAARRIRI
jgi:hypothetical protein